jgi:hypothetical protein
MLRRLERGENVQPLSYDVRLECALAARYLRSVRTVAYFGTGRLQEMYNETKGKNERRGHRDEDGVWRWHDEEGGPDPEPERCRDCGRLRDGASIELAKCQCSKLALDSGS